MKENGELVRVIDPVTGRDITRFGDFDLEGIEIIVRPEGKQPAPAPENQKPQTTNLKPAR